MREKSPRLAEPLKAEALLLRGEDVRATNPRERCDGFCTKFGLNHVQSASIGFCFAAYAPLVRIFISLALHTFWPITLRKSHSKLTQNKTPSDWLGV